MLEVVVDSYRHQSDATMTQIENPHRRPTYINPLYIVSLKPTAVTTDQIDIMTIDGMVYRTSVENMDSFIAECGNMLYRLESIVYAAADIRPTD